MEDTSASPDVQRLVDREVYRMWRIYRLCTLLHCTPLDLEQQPAVLLDWFMEFSAMENKIQNEKMESGNP